MLRKLVVEGLFGIYDYEIELYNEDNTKIITGPNGYGKTTILKILDNLLNNRLWYFYYLEFNSISVEFDSFFFFLKKKKIDRTDSDETKLLRKDFYDHKVDIDLCDLSGKIIESVEINSVVIQRLLRKITRNGWDFSQNISDQELLSHIYFQGIQTDLPVITKNISLSLQEYNSKFLPFQRLFSFGSEFQYYRGMHLPSYEIDHVNDSIILHYKNAQFLFASECQKIDATYMSRLLSLKRGGTYTFDELKKHLEKLRQRVAEFKSLNLLNDMEVLDLSKVYASNITSKLDVLSLYVDDMNKKMEILNPLYEKAKLFKLLLDKKILSDKEIFISERGMLFKNTKEKELTNLHFLSSGEQNLLILYYNMIFETSSHSILLIDEPENSLHVAWLRRMLDDYIQISKITKCQIILATHSPVLLNNRWDLITDLYRQHKGKI